MRIDPGACARRVSFPDRRRMFDNICTVTCTLQIRLHSDSTHIFQATFETLIFSLTYQSEWLRSLLDALINILGFVWLGSNPHTRHQDHTGLPWQPAVCPYNRFSWQSTLKVRKHTFPFLYRFHNIPALKG